MITTNSLVLFTVRTFVFIVYNIMITYHTFISTFYPRTSDWLFIT